MLAFFVLIIFDERGFYLIVFTMLRSKRGLYERQFQIYRSVPPAEDS